MAETRRDGEYCAALLNIREVCEMLRVSRPTVYRQIAAGELPIVKIGDRTLIRPADLEQFVSRAVRRRA